MASNERPTKLSVGSCRRVAEGELRSPTVKEAWN